MYEIFWKFLRPSPQARYISGNFFFPARASNFLKDFGKCRPAPKTDVSTRAQGPGTTTSLGVGATRAPTNGRSLHAVAPVAA